MQRHPVPVSGKRSLKFRFPVFFNEQELYELDWDNESTVESVLLMRRAKR